MIEFSALLEFIELNLKNNIKEGDYLKLLNLISKCYIAKQVTPEDYNSDDPEGIVDIY